MLIDREQGGEAHLAANGLKLHAAFKLSAMLDVLVAHGHVTEDVAAKVRAFIAANQTARPAAGAATSGGGAAKRPKRLTYETRAAAAKNAMARACLELMARKRTNLCVAADVATAEEMLDIADKVGPHICVLKTHVDIFDK